ncbi:MAG TPA: plastocyanin/azurin family copper-binding protein [Longimicrobium sp.]|nr:plastocyanin/azurin family copper-binding protein [Longimicrobium sp.]
MMRTIRALAAAVVLCALAACAPCPFPQTQPAGPVATEWVEATMRVVQMRTTQGGASGEFDPREVHARRGDLIRFRMADGDAHHNVSFTHFNGDTPGVQLPPDSPYLTEPGQSWQIRVDLPPGTYPFACVPHADAGHRGTLIVEP